MVDLAGMQEIHYCSLESQSNVYGLAKLSVCPEESKLLVAPLKGNILCVGFQKKLPSSRPVHFTYIPGDAEVISLDVFNKFRHSNGIVVGIAFAKLNKESDGKLFNFLNIYSELEVGAELDLDRIAQGCQSLELNFVPYQLYHTELFSQDGNVETVFLLSGGDEKIHVFKEAKNTHMFVENLIDDYFPEFIDLPGIVHCMDCINNVETQQRFSVVGCQNGKVSVSLVDTVANRILKYFVTEHDSPITCLRIFKLSGDQKRPEFIKNVPAAAATIHSGKSLGVPSDLNLLVANAFEPAVVYSCVFDRGFLDVLTLPGSDDYDCVLCCLVTDIDFDGQMEIILGTYGQKILVYKLQQSQSRSHKSSRNLSAEFSKSGSLSSAIGGLQDGEFSMIWERNLPEPVMAMEAVDLTSDGLDEIVILTLKGLHVLQHDLQKVSELCKKRMLRAINSDAKADIFETCPDEIFL